MKQPLLQSAAARVRARITRFSALSRRKKAIITAGGIIICALIVLGIDLVSPRDMLGFQKTGTEQRNPDIYDTSKDDFNPADFTASQTTATQSNTTVTVQYPVIPEQEIMNTIIQEQSSQFANTVANQSSTSQNYQFSAHAYDKYIFVTLWNTDPTTTAPHSYIFGLTKKSLLTPADILANGYADTLIREVSQTLAQRFQTSLELGKKLAQKAVSEHQWRLAHNGLIVILPTNELPASVQSTSYYEVLVPNAVLENYLQ